MQQMHYYFCPRCNFRMKAAKHLCPTCGYKIPRQPTAAKRNTLPEAENHASLWSKIIKLNFSQNHGNEPENKTEKPAIIS